MCAAGRCSARSGVVRRLVRTRSGTRSRIRGSTSDDRVGCSASDGRCAPARPALQRRCMSRRVFCRFCHARSRVPMVFGPFHYCAFCERATPDAPETIDDQRRCTGCRYRTIYGGSPGSASLPPAIADHVSYRVRAPDARKAHSYRRCRPACGSVVGWATCSAAFITI